jgi:hypothetical protein
VTATATPGQVESGRGTPSPSASSAGPNRRPAYCPLCGQARADVLANDVRRVEDALCAGRCDTAWHALEALRRRESSSARVATRKRLEYESRQPHPPALSELLLLRWRAGDWTVSPEGLLDQFAADHEAALGHDSQARA